jgi:hypothetical protein
MFYGCFGNCNLRWLFQINIVDTVVVEENIVVCYLYTGRDGQIKSKSQSYFALPKVRDEFIKIANALQHQSEVTLAVLHRTEGQPSILNSEFLSTLCNGGGSYSDPIVLQCFVPSKGSATSYSTYR